MSDKQTFSLVNIRDAILKSLAAQQGRRSTYDGTDWVDAERTLMLNETNTWRALLGKESVDVSKIRRVEQWAYGHSDYSSKFALYCAEIVLDCGPGHP